MAEKMTRRKAVQTFTVVPLLVQMGPGGLFASNAHTHPRVPVQSLEQDWEPVFFTPQQSETVATLADRIIPETDTPGARAAKVHQHIDFVLSNETPDVRQDFLRGLQWVDRRSQELFGSSYIDASPEQQTALLTIMASPHNRSSTDQEGRAFFQNIKGRTVFGYYTSEIGLIQELGYEGNAYLAEFPGCDHPEHLNWQPGQ